MVVGVQLAWYHTNCPDSGIITEKADSCGRCDLLTRVFKFCLAYLALIGKPVLEVHVSGDDNGGVVKGAVRYWGAPRGGSPHRIFKTLPLLYAALLRHHAGSRHSQPHISSRPCSLGRTMYMLHQRSQLSPSSANAAEACNDALARLQLLALAAAALSAHAASGCVTTMVTTKGFHLS